jgi:hypothetical protein
VRKVLVAAIALSAVASSFVTSAHAGPPVPGPNGRKCGFNSTTDPDPNQTDPDWQTGEINGGPIIGDGTLTCTMHVGGTGLHNDSATICASASASDGNVVILAEAFGCHMPENVEVYECTKWTPTGGTAIYWIPGNDNGTPTDPTDDPAGYWYGGPTPPAKACGGATSFSTGPIIDAINDILVGFDPLICGALLTLKATVSPLADDPAGVVYITPATDPAGGGDLYIAGEFIWDCPPYAP